MAQGIDNRAILDRIRIRRMTAKEVAFAIDLAAGEGWNPGIHDGACFYATDPAGFFVAELDGELVGSISAVAYNDSFGFMGLYIVKPEFRGIGIGTRLWEAGMAYLTGHNIGLAKEGVKLAPFSDLVPDDVRTIVKDKEQAIIEGKFELFPGMSDKELRTIYYLVVHKV